MVKYDKNLLLSYILPLTVILSSVGIALSPLLNQYPELVTGITYDLTLTAPLLFLFLSRNSSTSKLGAIPFFIVGIVIASYTLPKTEQLHLGYIKTYVLPFVELAIITILIRKAYRGFKLFKSNSNKTTDFYAISKKSAVQLFGKSGFAAFLSTEITMIYYALFSWEKKKLVENEFTGYKENASVALAVALLMVVFIETFTFHILLMKWNAIAAWIFTGTSIYTAFLIFAHLKALIQRPSVLTDEKLIFKNGLIADIAIPLNEIDKVEVYSKEMKSEEIKIGNLGLSKESTNHNVSLYFKRKQTIEKMYGFTEDCEVLLVHIDNKNDFVKKVKAKLEQHRN